MVKTRNENIKHVELFKWCMNQIIELGLIDKKCPEYSAFTDWLHSYILPKEKNIQLYIYIWHNDMVSQSLFFNGSYKEILVMASDSFWQINDEGLKWAYDGTWYLYSSKYNHPDKDFKNESFSNLEPLFKRLILNHSGSEQLKVQLYFD